MEKMRSQAGRISAFPRGSCPTAYLAYHLFVAAQTHHFAHALRTCAAKQLARSVNIVVSENARNLVYFKNKEYQKLIDATFPHSAHEEETAMQFYVKKFTEPSQEN